MEEEEREEGENEKERKGDLVAFFSFFLAFALHICNIIISLSDLHQCE